MQLTLPGFLDLTQLISSQACLPPRPPTALHFHGLLTILAAEIQDQIFPNVFLLLSNGRIVTVWFFKPWLLEVRKD